MDILINECIFFYARAYRRDTGSYNNMEAEMKIVIMLLLLFTVTITVNQPGELIPCPSPPIQIIQNKDGSYTRPSSMVTTLKACFSGSRTWQEEWTDYPENGGSFIRVIPKQQ